MRQLGAQATQRTCAVLRPRMSNQPPKSWPLDKVALPFTYSNTCTAHAPDVFRNQHVPGSPRVDASPHASVRRAQLRARAKSSPRPQPSNILLTVEQDEVSK